MCCLPVVCDTAKVRFFKQITTDHVEIQASDLLFAILQKYDFSSKSQHIRKAIASPHGCLRYCKSTIFQANHNLTMYSISDIMLFAILQKYDFSSKSQRLPSNKKHWASCLRYCKSTIFQANHNGDMPINCLVCVVCDTAKVRFFKQITTIAGDARF